MYAPTGQKTPCWLKWHAVRWGRTGAGGQKLRPTGAERVTSRESRGRQRQAGQVL